MENNAKSWEYSKHKYTSSEDLQKSVFLTGVPKIIYQMLLRKTETQSSNNNNNNPTDYKADFSLNIKFIKQRGPTGTKKRLIVHFYHEHALFLTVPLTVVYHKSFIYFQRYFNNIINLMLLGQFYPLALCLFKKNMQQRYKMDILNFLICKSQPSSWILKGIDQKVHNLKTHSILYIFKFFEYFSKYTKSLYFFFATCDLLELQ